jgi:ketosteroid isomerase-like protein
MSQENVELVRRGAEALARRDRTAWLATNDADFEVVTPPDWPERGVRGAEAAWELYLKFFDAFEPFAIDDAEVRGGDTAGEKVLLHYRLALSGRGSGAGVEFDYWAVFTVRQGKVRRAHWFADREEALEAAGPSE